MFLLDVFGFLNYGFACLLWAFAYPYSGVWPLEWPFSVPFALQQMGGSITMTAHEKQTDELLPAADADKTDHS